MLISLPYFLTTVPIRLFLPDNEVICLSQELYHLFTMMSWPRSCKQYQPFCFCINTWLPSESIINSCALKEAPCLQGFNLNCSSVSVLQLHMAEHPAGHLVLKWLVEQDAMLAEAGKEGKNNHTVGRCPVSSVFSVSNRTAVKWNSKWRWQKHKVTLCFLSQRASAGYWWIQWVQTTWRAGSRSTEEPWCCAGQCTLDEHTVSSPKYPTHAFCLFSNVVVVPGSVDWPVISEYR